ncbi:GNAT family N-acetyltransferase [Nocardia macrotermitis]|uniref:N-acetyltransferase Eis n=1 Tax=Nocardia macrotermitis TaxID=2585198 RepID=A0A7K0D0P1_9NOCA|nr:GNAT family N-acetyltransferase [Nocardia macrotermitis]MQY19293.1 N-acetyltransferase Eis [Nocardia macrotermitis]
MTETSGITLRSGSAADAEVIRLLGDIGFGIATDRAEAERTHSVFAPENGIVAHEGDRIVGYAATYTQTLTVPGGHPVEVSSIANVVVAPTHRRRGILRAMYTEQHRRTEELGLPLTIFTASQGGIYGRFGYGPSITEQHIGFDRRFAQFHSGTPDPGGVELTATTAARGVVPAIYDRWRRVQPGAQLRPEPAWDAVFADLPRYRGGGTELFAFTHPDGYALYRYHRRGSGSAIEVVELRAVTPDAHAALWRALSALELFDRVEAVIAPDDPLPHLFTDPRLVRTTGLRDALWTRLMDVPAALTARSYQADLDIVVAVDDPFRGAGGTFALRVRDGHAECAPTTRAADVELGIDVLGSVYLGAHRIRRMAAAHHIRAKGPAVLRALDLAFQSDRDPVLGWAF